MKRSFIMMLIVPFLWALNFVFGKVLVDLLPPFTIAGGRFTVAGIIFGLWLLLRKKKLPQTDFKFILNLILISLTGVVAFNGILYVGLKYTTVVNGTIVNSFNPIAIMLLAFLILREKVTWKQIVGAIISICGVAVIVSGGDFSTLTTLNIGDIIIFLNTFIWAVFTVLGKKVMQVMSPLETIAFTTCMGLPLLWLICGVELHYFPVVSLSLTTVLLVIFLGVFASVLSFIWWYQGINDFGASGAAAFYNLIPLYSLILSAIFLGETIHVFHILGCLLILGGVFISSQSINKKPVT